jgi:dienelactone hydrolase
LFLENLAHSGIAAAEIPVERIQGPVLLLCGGDDRVWPSELMADRLIERLRRNRRPYPDELLVYHGAGHWLPGAYVPTAGSRRRVKRQIGGRPEATARAQADGWPKIVRFLSTLSDRKMGAGAPARATGDMIGK